jgi:hypothetical protein
MYLKIKEEALRYRIIQIGLLLFFLLSGLPEAFTKDVKGPAQNRQVQWQYFDKITLQSLKEDPDLIYTQQDRNFYEMVRDFFRRLWQWLAEKINQLFNVNIQGTDVTIFAYVIASLVLIVGIYFLLKMSGFSLFFTNKKAGSTYIVGQENIHEINFEKEIAAFLRKQNFRMAIRHMYLWALKKMDDQGSIKWEPFKTEQHYRQEIADEQLKQTYGQMAYIFDFVWYGNFEADAAMADRMQRLLSQIERKEVAIEN